MNVFKICDKCVGTNIKTIVPKLKELDPNAEIDIKCHSFCGPGSMKPFVIVNERTVFATTEDEVIEKVRKLI
jgi:uncharacterized protein YuzB (UPF0349 family)